MPLNCAVVTVPYRLSTPPLTLMLPVLAKLPDSMFSAPPLILMLPVLSKVP